ncbi:MFS transporter [Paenibacillus sp. TAB 01]|uniref:MFS transporter n=1 Tax=Paenibacillus sp. TAB 01 TaxID=3368988 RepID=UPI003752EEFC
MLGLIFAELDETIVSTAMPTIIRELHGLSLYGWVAGIYMLAVTMFMPILGKLADLYGRKKIYLLCMGLFILGSIVSGSAGSMTWLLIGRGIQGIGAGGLMPLALVIIGETYPLEQRAKIQSLFGPLMILPQLLGPYGGRLSCRARQLALGIPDQYPRRPARSSRSVGWNAGIDRGREAVYRLARSGDAGSGAILSAACPGADR